MGTITKLIDNVTLLEVGIEPVGGSTTNGAGPFVINDIPYRMYRFTGNPQSVGTTGTFKVDTCS